MMNRDVLLTARFLPLYSADFSSSHLICISKPDRNSSLSQRAGRLIATFLP